MWCLVVLLSCCCAYLKRRHRRLANTSRLRNIVNHSNHQRRFDNNNQEINAALPIEKLPSYTDAIKSPNRDLPAPPPPAYVDMTGATGDNCFPPGTEHFTEIPAAESPELL